MESAQFKVVNSGVNSAYQPLAKEPTYYTVEQFSLNNPAFTQSSLRNLIFKSDERLSSNGVIAGNGLSQAGAIIRVGRKVLINKSKFYAWLEEQNKGA